MEHREIEVRFLEIDVNVLVEKLRALGADDSGETTLSEIIFYDAANTWQYAARNFVRLRTVHGKTFMAFKHNESATVAGTIELEVEVSNRETTRRFLEAVGLVAYREQEKRRHTFRLGEVTVDIDTWPGIPTYVELEGKAEDDLRAAAADLGLRWEEAVFESPRYVIEQRYGVPVSTYHFFTFDRQE